MTKYLWVIPFGKWKGKPIEDIETSYLEWISGEGWFKTKFKEGYKQIKQELKFRKDFGDPDLSNEIYEDTFSPKGSTKTPF